MIVNESGEEALDEDLDEKIDAVGLPLPTAQAAAGGKGSNENQES